MNGIPGGRKVLLVAHTGRAEVQPIAIDLVRQLQAAGLGVVAPALEAGDLSTTLEIEPLAAAGDSSQVPPECEVVLVLGGDGTILRAAELARAGNIPLLGVNLGHVGFLAEATPSDLDEVVASIVAKSWTVEERLALAARVELDGEVVAHTWALNEVSIERAQRERMVEVRVEVDGRPLSRWSGDGVVVSTPTGSTAYAFSAGGPVIWPAVQALLVVPIAAHALFARAIVLAPSSKLVLEVRPGISGAVLWADGRRTIALPDRARIAVEASQPVLFARLHESPFTDRLVARFRLPVEGWRG